jgi:chemotaxis protein methyltransferase CheR
VLCERYMNDSGSSEDPLRHIRFTGRATVPAAHSAKRAKGHTGPAKSARNSEQPGPFISWVLHRAGLAAESYRAQPLQRRLPACLRALHAHTEDQARETLDQRPELLPAAISALLIGVTDFFRDEPVFDLLRKQVLPDPALRARPLRVWSAGCSSGAELYSVAILLDQAGMLEGGHLLGTDCRQDAITYAKAALYNSHELRNIEPSPRHKHFEPVGALWRPIEPLRRHVHWKVADLSRGVEKGPWDIILWRNMAIYLTAEAAGAVWRGLVSVLADGGVLVVGKAERPPVELPLSCVGRCIYRAAPRGRGHGCGAQSKNHRGPRASEKSV